MLNLKIPKNNIIANAFGRDKVVNIKGLRKQNLPYVFIWIVYYAWVITFATWWTASPLTENVFGTELRNLLHSVSLISSALFVFIIKKEQFVKNAKVGAVLIVSGMIIFMTIQSAHIQLFSAIVIGISLGLVNASILMPFVFALNNTEKLYAVVGSNVLINFFSLFQEGNKGNYLQSNKDMILSLVILVIALSTVLFFKENCIPAESNDKTLNKIEFHPRVYLTLFFNCLFAIMCKGAGKGVLNITAGSSSIPVLIWYYIGGLAGCLIYILIYAFSKRSIHLAWNITFGCLAMGLLCNAFSVQLKRQAVVFAILLGIGSTIGMINMYYILGVIGKKYNSMRYIRLSILFIGICGGVSGVAVGNLINRINTLEISIVASIVSTAVMMLLLVMSPLLTQTYYGDEWAKDSEKMEIDNENLQMFKKYQLSKREIEVCKLLLQGYTLRQISAMLSIAYPTVNTYCTSLYRKLEINSRTELLILFKDYVHK